MVGMRPSAQSIILGNQWSSRARDRFITLVKGHSLIASLYSILHGVMRVHLLITSETENTNVVDIMVQEGHAVKAEESFDSKVGVESCSLSWKSIRECVCWADEQMSWDNNVAFYDISLWFILFLSLWRSIITRHWCHCTGTWKWVDTFPIQLAAPGTLVKKKKRS